MADYFVIAAEEDAGYCAIWESPSDFPNRHYPADGERMGASYPEGFQFSMSADVPAMKIADVIDNALGYFMVSAKLKGVLEKHASAEIEFLRFVLMNHKGRVASDDCYIANVIGTVDCVDKGRTEGDEDPVNKGRYMFIERLFLDDSKLNPELNIFRIASRPRVIVVREDLKAVLENEEIEGVEFFEMGEEVSLE